MYIYIPMHNIYIHILSANSSVKWFQTIELGLGLKAKWRFDQSLTFLSNVGNGINITPSLSTYSVLMNSILLSR